MQPDIPGHQHTPVVTGGVAECRETLLTTSRDMAACIVTPASRARPRPLPRHPRVLWNTGVAGEGAWPGAAGGSHDTYHHVT